MHDSILNFAKQFDFVPEMKNGNPPTEVKKIILAGMGGSHLSAELLKLFDSTVDIYIHRDYGLPPFQREMLSQSLLIASSYSGNTEETIDFTKQALADGLRPIIITTGGALLELAISSGLPYVIMPNNVIQPRVALGLSITALAFVTGNYKLSSQLRTLAGTLNPSSFEKQGQAIALQLRGKMPLLYSSQRNETVVYNWKVRINETAKIPAFCNVFPEFSHNELAGFSSEGKNGEPQSNFHCLFFKDKNDHPRVQKRMDLTVEMISKQEITSSQYIFEGETQMEKIFNSIIVADWTAYHLALIYKANPDEIAIIKEFKEKMANGSA